jgi:hypothetical protein
MQWRHLNEHHGERTSALVLETGDETLECLQRFARESPRHLERR